MILDGGGWQRQSFELQYPEILKGDDSTLHTEERDLTLAHSVLEPVWVPRLKDYTDGFKCYSPVSTNCVYSTIRIISPKRTAYFEIDIPRCRNPLFFRAEKPLWEQVGMDVLVTIKLKTMLKKTDSAYKSMIT